MRFLYYIILSINNEPASVVNSDSHGPGNVLAETSGLDLLEGESASSPLLDVVLEGGAAHNGAEQLGGAGSNAGSLKISIFK